MEDRCNPASWMNYSVVNSNRTNVKSPLNERAFYLNRSLAMFYFHMGEPTLSSTLFRFTSEFGMESGGSKTL